MIFLDRTAWKAQKPALIRGLWIVFLPLLALGVIAFLSFPDLMRWSDERVLQSFKARMDTSVPVGDARSLREQGFRFLDSDFTCFSFDHRSRHLNRHCRATWVRVISDQSHVARCLKVNGSNLEEFTLHPAEGCGSPSGQNAINQ